MAQKKGLGQTILDSLKSAPGQIGHALKHKFRHGEHELASALYTGNGFVQYADQGFPPAGQKGHGVHGPESSPEPGAHEPEPAPNPAPPSAEIIDFQAARMERAVHQAASELPPDTAGIQAAPEQQAEHGWRARVHTQQQQQSKSKGIEI